MPDDVLSKGKVSRKLGPYAGVALLLVATIGFFIQFGFKGDDGSAKQRALEERERIEAAQLGSKVVSEDEARKEIEAKEAAVRAEMKKREDERAEILSAKMPPASLPPMGGGLSEDSLRRYEAAKFAAAPGSKEKAGMVAFEDFPSAKQNFASVVHGQATLPPQGDVTQKEDPQVPPDEDKNRAWADHTKTRIKAGTSDYLKPDVLAAKSVLLQGTVISAVTRTALNTKLPGQIVAVVTQDVYDSIKAETLLLPKGSQLIGEYNTAVMDGQNRVMMAFTRLIFPTGASVKLGAMSASDALGVAGSKGKVNSHFFKRLGSSLLLAILADKINQPSSVTILNTGSAASSATAAGEVLSSTAEKELERSAKITPDISLPHGSKVSLILAADLALPTSITSKIPTED